jgi:sulfate-transporting ATPase
MLVTYVLIGLGTGGLYALAALGLVAIETGSRVLNFAHGAVAFWAAYIFLELRDAHHWNGAPAAAAALACTGVAGVAIYAAVIRPLRHRTPLVRLVATLGLMAFLQGLALRVVGSTSVLVASSIPDASIRIAGAYVGEDWMIILGLAVGLAGALALWSARSRFALATRAMVAHPEAAVALGFSPDMLGAVNWALGSMLAGAAGILAAQVSGFGVEMMGTLLVFGLSAALVGRFESYGLALAGGLILGVSESLAAGYIHTPGWGSAVPVVAVLVVLLIRPQRGLNRLASSPAVPVSAARWPAWAIAAVVGLAIVAVARADVSSVDALTVTFAFAGVGGSLVLLVGYANQLSLGQLAIAGVAALIVTQLRISAHLPFEVAPLVGAGIGAAVGALVGLPALRVRGTNLAVVTIALSLAVEQAVFANPAWAGGYNGLTPPAETIFGVQVDAIAHPRGYAAVALFWTALTLLSVAIIRRSRLGRQMLAVRTNERAAAAHGISVARTKILAFSCASAMAGAAGVLLASSQPTENFDQFGLFDSLGTVVYGVVGGIGSILGAVIAGLLSPGGLIAQVVTQWWSSSATWAPMLFGVAVILAMQFRPAGLAGRHRDLPTTFLPVEAKHAPARPSRSLSARAMVVRFGGVVAVDGVDVTVDPGQIVGLIGPNGAGKTTLVDGISGLAPTAGGRVALGERDLSRVGASGRARLGVIRVFQSGELFEDLTLGDNLRAAAENAGPQSTGSLPACCLAFLQATRLDSRLGATPEQLTTGERRLASVARALAANPAVLLLDEPGAGLAAEEIRELAVQVRAMAQPYQLAILLIDHNMDLVRQACDQVLVLVGGRVIAHGTPDEVAADPKVRDAYLGVGSKDDSQSAVAEPGAGHAPVTD